MVSRPMNPTHANRQRRPMAESCRMLARDQKSGDRETFTGNLRPPGREFGGDQGPWGRLTAAPHEPLAALSPLVLGAGPPGQTLANLRALLSRENAGDLLFDRNLPRQPRRLRLYQLLLQRSELLRVRGVREQLRLQR